MGDRLAGGLTVACGTSASVSRRISLDSRFVWRVCGTSVSINQGTSLDNHYLVYYVYKTYVRNCTVTCHARRGCARETRARFVYQTCIYVTHDVGLGRPPEKAGRGAVESRLLERAEVFVKQTTIFVCKP